MHTRTQVDAINTHDKLGVLVHDLLVIELWRERVFPRIKGKLSDFQSVKAYVILYHEATVCNLLEVLMYHQRYADTYTLRHLATHIHARTHTRTRTHTHTHSMMEGAGDALAELVDYCYRKLTLLASGYFSPLQEEQDAKVDSTRTCHTHVPHARLAHMSQNTHARTCTHAHTRAHTGCR